MAFVLKDRVKESTTTTGTSAITLSGALATFDTFQTYMSNGDTTYYAIAHKGNGIDEWEVGIGTWNTGNTLSRTTILGGSNGTSAVNFSAGEKEIFMSYIADKAVYKDASGNISVPGTVDGRDLAADGTKLDGIESGATADQTAAEIRSLVESASDSNVFTDADHTKLNGIESGATADQTASEILTAIKTVDGSGSGLDADNLDGRTWSSTRNAANTLVTRDGNGYAQLGWINTTSGVTTATLDRIYASNDGYIRYVTPATLRSQLGGSGSGLDADTLDGVQGSSFLRSDTADTFTDLRFPSSSNNARFVTSGSWGGYLQTDSGYIHFGPANTTWAHIYTDRPNFYFNKNLYVNGSLVWHSGNDGSGSTLDADTVDGLHESTFMRKDANSGLDMNNNNIDYVNQLHFNAGVRFVDESNDQYLVYRWNDTGAGGIRFKDGNDLTHGYVYGDGAGRFGLLDNDGNWAVRIQTGTSPLELRCNNNVELQVYTSYVYAQGSFRAPNFYVDNVIYHNGDTDTYMQFHAADQWRVVTGGAERLEVNNSAVTVAGNLTVGGTISGTISYLSGLVYGAWVNSGSTSNVNSAYFGWLAMDDNDWPCMYVEAATFQSGTTADGAAIIQYRFRKVYRTY